MLTDHDPDWFAERDKDVIRNALSADAVYAELREELASYFAKQRQ